MSKCKLIFLLILLAPLPAIAADFLIVKEPGKLSILNQYEQPVSTDELKSFLPYSSFQVINRHELLGDQITYAMHCKYLNKTFFLINNDNGDMLSKNKIFYQRYFSGCTILDDTVIYKSSSGLTVYEQYPSGGNTSSINKDEKVIRIFQFAKNIYILRLSQPQKFGWCPATQNFTKQTEKTTTFMKPDIATDIYCSIQSRLKRANENYDSIFSYFNKLTQKDNSIPKWTISKDGNTIRCTLKGSTTIQKQLESSTNYLFRDIEQLLLGKGFETNYSNGEIVIQPRLSGL